MEEKKNVLEKRLEFREEELESGLSKEDKKHMYDFEKCADMVLNCVDGDMYNFAKKELDKLEGDVLDSMGHFNRKYYMAGFSDAVEIILSM
ncbi:MAG: hypothetical protein HFJ41_07070 [Clostridia bacterium]|jgi:hypothetical protein|nr:hypothetical protein [Clostridia bacterium]